MLRFVAVPICNLCFPLLVYTFRFLLIVLFLHRYLNYFFFKDALRFKEADVGHLSPLINVFYIFNDVF
jgi:hypothetical protein